MSSSKASCLQQFPSDLSEQFAAPLSRLTDPALNSACPAEQRRAGGQDGGGLRENDFFYATTATHHLSCVALLLTNK